MMRAEGNKTSPCILSLPWHISYLDIIVYLLTLKHLFKYLLRQICITIYLEENVYWFTQSHAGFPWYNCTEKTLTHWYTSLVWDNCIHFYPNTTNINWYTLKPGHMCLPFIPDTFLYLFIMTKRDYLFILTNVSMHT